MAGITVHCTDGTIRLNGDFQERLAEIKSLTNRKYDSVSKTWSVGVSMDFFRGFDVVSGQGKLENGAHMSRYGNTYRANEWAGVQAGNAAKRQAAAAFSDERTRREADALAILKRTLLVPGSDPQSIDRLVDMIRVGKFAALVENGRIKFVTPGRKKIVEAAVDAYEDALGRIAMDADDREAAAEEAAWDAWGVR